MTEKDKTIQDLRRANDILRDKLAELVEELARQERTLAEVREEADRRIKAAEALSR